MTPTRAIGVVTISMARDAVSMANVLMCNSFSEMGIADHWGFPPRNPEIPRGRSGVPCTAGDAVRAVDVESLAICDASQASIDGTQARDAFSDARLIPPEMKEVIEVTFKCRAEDR